MAPGTRGGDRLTPIDAHAGAETPKQAEAWGVFLVFHPLWTRPAWRGDLETMPHP